jgi:hypothetical protein
LGALNAGTKTYLVEDTPKHYQTVPWFNVLDLACDWADNEAGIVNCAHDVTFGLYYSQLIAYNLGTEEVPTVWFDNNNKFKLKEFFETPGYKDGNCVDVSTFNSICMNALGLTTQLNQQIQDEFFVTNPICPIGSDSSSVGNYFMVIFGMHQQVHISGNVFDAAIALVYDLSGSAYMNPPANWPMGAPGYWQTPYSPPAYGLTKRYFHSASDDPTISTLLSPEQVDYSTDSFSYAGVI